jgi:hypothetical protein
MMQGNRLIELMSEIWPDAQLLVLMHAVDAT